MTLGRTSRLCGVVFVLLLYSPLASVLPPGAYAAASASAVADRAKAVNAQVSNFTSGSTLLNQPGPALQEAAPDYVANDVVAWGSGFPPWTQIGYTRVDAKSGQLVSGTWTPPVGGATIVQEWQSEGFLFAQVALYPVAYVYALDATSQVSYTLPLFVGTTVTYGLPVDNGSYFATIGQRAVNLTNGETAHPSEIDTASVVSGSWSTAVSSGFQELTGTCKDSFGNPSPYDFGYQQQFPWKVLVGDQGNFVWLRYDYQVLSDANGCPYTELVGEDVVLNSNSVVASSPASCDPTTNICNLPLNIIGFWGHIILYDIVGASATTFYVYDTNAKSTSPALPPGQDFCTNGCTSLYVAVGYKSDGNSLIWASANSTGTGDDIYLYNSKYGVKLLASNQPNSFLGFTSDLVAVSGNWAMWVNSTSEGGQLTGSAITFYNLANSDTVSVPVAYSLPGQIDTDGSNHILFDFQQGRLAWVTGEGSATYQPALLHIYDLNRWAAGLNPYSDVYLGLFAGTISMSPLIVTPDEIFFNAVPIKVAASGSTQTQVFAVQPATLTPVIIIPDFARTRLDAKSGQVWPGGAPAAYLTSKQKKALVVADFTMCGGSCGGRYKLFLNQSLPLYTPTNFSKSIKVRSIFDYMTVPLQHTPITPNGAPAVNIVINKTLAKLTNAYSGLEKALNTVGYETGTNLLTMPYDWRFDYSFQYDLLDRVIQIAQNNTGSYQVVLIAHGSGGLIAEGYIASQSNSYSPYGTSGPRPYEVNSIIAIGTPFAGEPKAFYALVNGYSFGNPTADSATMKILLQDYVSLYELLPNQPFIISAGNATKLPKLVTFKDLANWCALTANSCPDINQFYGSIGFHGFNETITKGKSSLANVSLQQGQNPEAVFNSYSGATSYSLKSTKENPWTLNSTFLMAQNQFYGAINSSGFPVQTYNIIGAGVSTLSAYIMRSANSSEVKKGQYLDYYPTNFHVIGNASKVVLVPYFANGDGTVPLWSQVTNYPDFTNLYFYTSSNHDKMVSDRKVDAMILQILAGARTEQDLCGGTPPNCKFNAHFFSKNTEKTSFTLHSDAELIVNDTSDGSTFGLNIFGGYDENSSRGDFENFQGVEYATVNNATAPLRVSLNGTESGDATLDVALLGATNSSFAYQNIPVANGSLAVLGFNPIQVSPSSPPQLATLGNGLPTSTNTQSQTSILGTTSTQTTPGGGGGGGIPEFPLQPLAAAAFVAIIATSYLVASRGRRRARGRRHF